MPSPLDKLTVAILLGEAESTSSLASAKSCFLEYFMTAHLPCRVVDHFERALLSKLFCKSRSVYHPYGENRRTECLASVVLPGGRAMSHHFFFETHLSPIARGVELESSLPENFTV